MKPDIFKRRMAILDCLKTANTSLKVMEIIRRLEDEGSIAQAVDGTTRDPREKQVQRDLVYLRDDCSLVQDVESDGRALLWKFASNGRDLYARVSRDSDLALTVILAKRYLARILPESTKASLNALSDPAARELENRGKFSQKDYTLLSRRIAFDQRGGRLANATINPEILNCIIEAIVRNCRISFTYNDRNVDASINGILIKEPKVYLVVQKEDSQGTSKPRQYLVHRMHNVAYQKERTSRVRRDFSLQSYVDDWQSEPFVDPHDTDYRTLKLRVKNTGNLLKDLEESGIGENREIVLQKNKQFAEYQAQVRFTYPVLEWILARGDDVKVIGDRRIKEVIRSRVAAMAALYT